MNDQAAEIEGYPGPCEVDEAPDGAALQAIVEKWGMPDSALLSKLPKGGKKDANGKLMPSVSCSVCSGFHAPGAVHLDYMGHADVTLALIDIDPYWDWAPLGTNEDGSPVIRSSGTMAVMWGTLTVLGVTRRCVGSCEKSKPEVEKELIGDLLRNGAMRFGIATKLWSKTEREEQKLPSSAPRAERAPAAKKQSAPRQEAAPREAADDAQGQESPREKEKRRMFVLIKNVGDVSQEDRLGIAGRFIGRELGSTNELDLAEVRRFNAALDGITKGTHAVEFNDKAEPVLVEVRS